MTSGKSSLYEFPWHLKCHSRVSSVSVLSLLPFFVPKVKKVKSTHKLLTPYYTAASWVQGCAWRIWCRWRLGYASLGVSAAQGGGATGHQPGAVELWDTVICCLQLPGWLHSLYNKYLLTTYHVEDTLLGTLRHTQEYDTCPFWQGVSSLFGR